MEVGVPALRSPPHFDAASADSPKDSPNCANDIASAPAMRPELLERWNMNKVAWQQRAKSSFERDNAATQHDYDQQHAEAMRLRAKWAQEEERRSRETTKPKEHTINGASMGNSAGANTGANPGAAYQATPVNRKRRMENGDDYGQAEWKKEFATMSGGMTPQMNGMMSQSAGWPGYPNGPHSAALQQQQQMMMQQQHQSMMSQNGMMQHPMYIQQQHQQMQRMGYPQPAQQQPTMQPIPDQRVPSTSCGGFAMASTADPTTSASTGPTQNNSLNPCPAVPSTSSEQPNNVLQTDVHPCTLDQRRPTPPDDQIATPPAIEAATSDDLASLDTANLEGLESAVVKNMSSDAMPVLGSDLFDGEDDDNPPLLSQLSQPQPTPTTSVQSPFGCLPGPASCHSMHSAPPSNGYMAPQTPGAAQAYSNQSQSYSSKSSMMNGGGLGAPLCTSTPVAPASGPANGVAQQQQQQQLGSQSSCMPNMQCYPGTSMGTIQPGQTGPSGMAPGAMGSMSTGEPSTSGMMPAYGHPTMSQQQQQQQQMHQYQQGYVSASSAEMYAMHMQSQQQQQSMVMATAQQRAVMQRHQEQRLMQQQLYRYQQHQQMIHSHMMQQQQRHRMTMPMDPRMTAMGPAGMVPTYAGYPPMYPGAGGAPVAPGQVQYPM